MNGVFELAPQNFLTGNSECMISDLAELSDNMKTRLLKALGLHPAGEIHDNVTRLVRDALVNKPLDMMEKGSVVDIDALKVPKGAVIAEVLQVFGNIFAEKDFIYMDALEALVSLEYVMNKGIIPSKRLFELTLQNRPLMGQGYMTNSPRARATVNGAYDYFDHWFKGNIGRMTRDEIDAFSRMMNLLEQSRT